MRISSNVVQFCNFALSLLLYLKFERRFLVSFEFRKFPAHNAKARATDTKANNNSYLMWNKPKVTQLFTPDLPIYPFNPFRQAQIKTNRNIPNFLNRGREYKRGKYHCTIDLLFDWFGLVCFANIKKSFVSCYAAYSKPVKQEVNSTVILPPLEFPDWGFAAHLSAPMSAP
jgi:hypothetical protein